MLAKNSKKYTLKATTQPTYNWYALFSESERKTRFISDVVFNLSIIVDLAKGYFYLDNNYFYPNETIGYYGDNDEFAYYKMNGIFYFGILI